MVNDFIEEVSRKVWRKLAQVKRSTGISINEETLTENLLYDFLEHNSANIRFLQTRKDIEGVQGTDWEWFVGSNKFGWVRFAIQAKRIDLETKRYESLRYFSGESSKKQLQSDILRKYASKNNALPLYMFYNFYDRVKEKDHWHCDREFDEELLGLTYLPLNKVTSIYTTPKYNTFDIIHRVQKAKPVRCLFSCNREMYFDRSTINASGKYLGEEFKKVEKLPAEFLKGNDITNLEDYPELYSPEIKIYPKNVAIIEYK